MFRRRRLLRRLFNIPSVDSSEEKIKKVVESWRAAGISERFIEWGIKMAENWAEAYANLLLPEDPEKIKRIIRARAYEFADAWIREMTAASG